MSTPPMMYVPLPSSPFLPNVSFCSHFVLPYPRFILCYSSSWSRLLLEILHAAARGSALQSHRGLPLLDEPGCRHEPQGFCKPKKTRSHVHLFPMFSRCKRVWGNAFRLFLSLCLASLLLCRVWVCVCVYKLIIRIACTALRFKLAVR